MLLKPPWITTAAHTFLLLPFFYYSESPVEYPLQVMESGSNSEMGQLGCKKSPAETHPGQFAVGGLMKNLLWRSSDISAHTATPCVEAQQVQPL